MNRVKELREAAGLSQKELAEILKISQGTASNWERSIHDPDNETLTVLSDMFMVSIDYILFNSDIPQKDFKDLDSAFFRVLQIARSSGISPHDLELAIEFLKKAKERDNEVGTKE